MRKEKKRKPGKLAGYLDEQMFLPAQRGDADLVVPDPDIIAADDVTTAMRGRIADYLDRTIALPSQEEGGLRAELTAH